jgi:hypothetical protein
MIEKLSLDAIKEQMIETKKLQEQTLKKLKGISSSGGASMEAAQLKELNKAIKVVEKSMKLYADI